ncbi:FtsX-like permease family protein [Spiroplasma sp. BIUS-1]|uniref:FtsX-like permease family protein n=1 Tax=Spiroplasma sp. BIUS-1 TaxID=216964 RepID=UPI001398F174|nr:FtsX-like permease family protein [Spiroplasma sp. BIUS-1]QHX36709.1 hypothetical protein SBIUS_v1c04560 [Spiroplasma sp. BIUS-1]
MKNSLVLKQLFFYKTINLSIFITLLICSMFTNSSLFLLLSSKEEMGSDSNMLLIFIILFGLILLISTIMITIIIGINFESRKKEIINQRLLGISNKIIFWNLLKEQLIIMIPSFVLGFVFAIILNKVLVDQLIVQGVLSDTFKVSYKFVNVFLVFLIGIVSLVFVIYTSTKKYNQLENNYKVSKKVTVKKTVLKSIFGSLFILSFLALIIFENSEVLYLFASLFFLIGLMIVLELALKLFFSITFKITKRNFMISSSIKNMQFNAGLISKIIVILVNSMVFLYFSINVIQQMSQVTYEGSENENYMKGLQFLSQYLNLVFLIFSFVVIVNGFMMYLKITNKENKVLRKLGFTNEKILMRNTIQFIFIWSIFLFLSFTTTLFISLIWNDTKTLENLWMWFVEVFCVLAIMLTIIIFDYILKIVKDNKKMKNELK